MEDNTELELILVTSDKVDGSECGPDGCPWINCGVPST